jgi:hypothetical protein
MSEKVVLGRDEMDRLVLMRMDLDRYEAELIPDLYKENLALRHALRRLVQVIQEADTQVSPDASNRHSAALHDAKRLLGECLPTSASAHAVAAGASGSGE